MQSEPLFQLANDINAVMKSCRTVVWFIYGLYDISYRRGFIYPSLSFHRKLTSIVTTRNYPPNLPSIGVLGLYSGVKQTFPMLGVLLSSALLQSPCNPVLSTSYKIVSTILSWRFTAGYYSEADNSITHHICRVYQNKLKIFLQVDIGLLDWSRDFFILGNPELNYN
jgi:hypothetical protein